MSLITTIQWLPSNGNLAAIASSQALGAAGALQLNTSTLVNQSANPFTQSGTTLLPNGGPYIYNNVARTVSISSTANLTGAAITITGLGVAPNGGIPLLPLSTPISETIAVGPNNDSVDSVNYYTQINSITINAAAANISAGFGVAGITAPISMDYDRTGWYATCSAQAIDNVSATYSGFTSLNKLAFPSTVGNFLTFDGVYGVGIPGFPIAAAMTVANTNEIEQLLYPVSLVWFEVLLNAYANAGEGFIFTVLQQGIR